MRMTGMMTALALLVAGTAASWADEAHVARAQFTTAVEDREPVNRFDRIDTSVGTVFFFTELLDLEGHTVSHRWMHDGAVQGEVDFEVGGPRWRVWSSKDLVPGWTGAWTVEVVDERGTSHGRWTFVYTSGSPSGG